MRVFVLNERIIANALIGQNHALSRENVKAPTVYQNFLTPGKDADRTSLSSFLLVGIRETAITQETMISSDGIGRTSRAVPGLFECEVIEEREVLQEAELSGQADSENDLGGSSETMYFIRLDVHKKSIGYCVKDAAGSVNQEGTIGTSRRELDVWIRTMLGSLS